MQIAIHHREGSFSERWIQYCAEHEIPYQTVDAYDSDILRRLAAADAFLWHWSHGEPRDLLMARHLITAAEMMGLGVFPNVATCWHFDDKVAQKYLLEAVGAPLVPTYVFYDLKSAESWIERATFPKVFKLRRGAGSANVRLVADAADARRLARRAFGAGFRAMRYLANADVRLKRVRRERRLVRAFLRFPSVLLSTLRLRREMGREKGYLYFQDFIPDNAFDTRVTIIGHRAFAFTRNVRKNDFRASGSGSIDYSRDRIDRRCLQTAFEVARRIGTQSAAFDFLSGGGQGPRIAEVSYAYLSKPVHDCGGYWDEQLTWHDGPVWPEDAILEDLLAEVDRKRRAAAAPGTEATHRG